MAREFDLIKRYFHDIGPVDSDIVVDIGDDAVVLNVDDVANLVMTLDVLVEGIHFPQNTPAARIAHKALAVNLSDLAAMGAQPRWFTLGLSLPEPDEPWISSFASSLATMAQRYGVRLVGGDTTRGPLSISINACGTVMPGSAITRSGANVGDRVLVSGSIGGAALGLDSYLGKLELEPDERESVRDRLDLPDPRCLFGMGLPGLASAAIDLSDGLGQDLGHVLDASAVGARIELNKLPLHPVYRRRLVDLGYEFAITFGDDYELLITAPERKLTDLYALAKKCDLALTEIGAIEQESRLRLIDDEGNEWSGSVAGHDHFRA